MRVRISKQGKKIEAARQFNVEVVNHFKSHVAKLELEKEDLKREISRNMLKQTQPGVGPQFLQLPLQFSGQVADNLPRIGGQQANHIAAFEPGVEEIELEELDEEDFAPPPATNSRRETLQVASRPWVSDAQWQQGVRRSKRGHNMQEDHLHLRNGKKVRGRTLLDSLASSPMRLF